MRRFLLLFCLALPTLIAHEIQAEPLRHPLAGNDPFLPPYSVAGDEGLLGLYLNPAALSMRPGEWGALGLWGLRGQTNDPALEAEFDQKFTDDWSLTLGGALAFGLDRFSGIGGYRYQVEEETRTPLWRRGWRMNIAYGHRFSIFPWQSELALGAAFRWTKSDAYAMDGLSGWDLGLLFRWRRWASLGFSARNFNSPELKPIADGDPQTLSPTYVGGIALRPGIHWATLSFDLEQRKLEQDWEQRLKVGLDMNLKGRLRLRLNGDDDSRFSLAFYFNQSRWQAGFNMGDENSAEAGTNYGSLNLEWRNRIFGRPLLSNRRFLELDLRDGDLASPGAGDSAQPTRDIPYLVERLRRAAGERDIAGLLLWVDGLQLGLAEAEDLRQALLNYRQVTGKPVVVQADRYSMNAYYLASAGSKVICNPDGGLLLEGISLRRRSYAGFLRSRGIEPRFFQDDIHATALASLSADSLPEFLREEDRQLLEKKMGALVGAIARDRRLEAPVLRRAIDRGWYAAEEAKGAGLVDEHFHPGQVPGYLDRLAGTKGRIDLDELDRRVRGKLRWGEEPYLAVLSLDGALVRGESGAGPLGEQTGVETVTRALRRARENPLVRGIILRMDSNGGGALASQRIRREILVAHLDKPLVIATGDLCLGGAYLGGLESARLFVNENTILGGIGALGGKLDWSAYRQAAGIDEWVEGSGSQARILDPFTGFTDQEVRAIRAAMADRYREFIELVADRRHISAAEVNRSAQGRCWDGASAVSMDLADEVGGFGSALAALRALARLDEEAPLRPLSGEAASHSAWHLGGGPRAEERGEALADPGAEPVPLAPGDQLCRGELILLYDPSLSSPRVDAETPQP